MEIALMGGWNTDSGASFHCELLGRTLSEKGHKINVFTFYRRNFHGTQIIGKDEGYVTRCFTTSKAHPPKLDIKPFLIKDYDIFTVEDLGMLPKKQLAKIFPEIKKKAKTINIIHDGKPSTDPSFWKFDWDAIVCFDKRYKKFLVKAYDKDKIHIIPYPCHEWKKGNKNKSRKKLNLPTDKKIIFLFGPAAKHTVKLIPSINKIASAYPILLLIATKDKEAVKLFNVIKKKIQKTQKQKEKEKLNIEIRQETPDIKRLYDYLHSADCLLFNKKSTDHVVISSTAFQCLGSGCPIIARNSNYVECFNKEIMSYSNEKEFKKALIDIFSKSKKYYDAIKAVKVYVKHNSAQAISKKYIRLFNSLLK